GGLASPLHPSANIGMEGVQIDGHHQPKDDPTPIDAVEIGPHYFEAVGVPLVEGRGFTEDEVEGSRRVAVVNEAFARRYWPGQSAVGRHAYTSGFDKPAPQVVGAPGDHK